jgi:hypothetical protein
LENRIKNIRYDIILPQPKPGCTNLTVANTLAYFSLPSVTKKTVFKTLTTKLGEGSGNHGSKRGKILGYFYSW